MYKSEKQEHQWRIAELSDVLNVNHKDIEFVDMDTYVNKNNNDVYTVLKGNKKGKFIIAQKEVNSWIKQL